MLNTHRDLSQIFKVSYIKWTWGISQAFSKTWGQRSGHRQCEYISLWSETLVSHFSSWMSPAGLYFISILGFSSAESLLFGDPRREINFARPLCRWKGTSAYINIHMRLFQMLSLGTGAVDEPRAVWSSGLCTRVSLDHPPSPPHPFPYHLVLSFNSLRSSSLSGVSVTSFIYCDLPSLRSPLLLSSILFVPLFFPHLFSFYLPLFPCFLYRFFFCFPSLISYSSSSSSSVHPLKRHCCYIRAI